MNEKEVLNFINELEEDYRVTEWSIFGVNIWPLIRLEIGERLCNSNLKTECQYHDGTGIKKLINRLISEIKIFLELYLCDYRKNSVYNGEDVVCIVDNDSREMKVDDGYYSVSINPIADQLREQGLSVFNFEYVSPGKEILPRNNKSKIINMGVIFEIAKSKICFNVKRNPNLPNYDKVIELCKQKGLLSDIFHIDNLVIFLLAAKKYYIKAFKKYRPKLIVISNWRNAKQMPLTMAAKELEIPCIEINHGYYGQDCFTHFKWTNEPKNGYELRPDYYWCWTKRSSDIMNKEALRGKAIAGYPPKIFIWGNMLKEKYHDEECKLKKLLPKNKKIILVTLNNVISRDEYPKWFLDLVSDTEEEFFWLFRKHHASTFSGQDVLCNEIECLNNTEWRYSSEWPLLLLLENVDVHVTYNSSVVIEAAFMGVPSIILSGMFKDRFREQIESGEAVYVHNYNEMKMSIKNYSNVAKANPINYNAVREIFTIIKA